MIVIMKRDGSVLQVDPAGYQNWGDLLHDYGFAADARIRKRTPNGLSRVELGETPSSGQYTVLGKDTSGNI